MKRTFSRSTRSQDSFQSLDTLSSYNVCVADIFTLFYTAHHLLHTKGGDIKGLQTRLSPFTQNYH